MKNDMIGNRKQVTKKLLRSKPFLALFIFGICVSVVSAGWLVSYFIHLDSAVIGTGPVFAVDLDPAEFTILMDTNPQKSQYFILENLNNPLLVAFDYSMVQTPTEELCPFDSENPDCSIQLSREDLSQINSG